MGEEKKLKHIQVKDNGIKLSNKVGDVLSDAKAILENKIATDLIKGVDNPYTWAIRQNILIRDFKKDTSIFVKETNKNVKETLKKDTTVNLTNKQVLSISNQINKGTLLLENQAIKAYQDAVRQTQLSLRVNKAMELKEALSKHLQTGLNFDVVYADGKTYKFDSYWEMKTRTEIQKDIGSNMVSAGREAGVIFYIAAYFGDCAKDHVDYQGKIYVDKDWESNAPKDRLEEIRSYIESHKIMTVQEVMEAPCYFTTRPNCRHYFSYIDIDSVLGAKTKDDVNKLRNERNLNFNGKYQPEKYKALQQQRQNERKIREAKADLAKAEQVLKIEPNDKTFQIKKENAKANIRFYQIAQRKLENQYTNIERRYDREALKVRTDFEGESTKIKVKFTDADNDRLIGRKRIGLSKKSFEYINFQSQKLLKKLKKDVKMEVEQKLDPRLYYEDYLVRNYYHEQLDKIKSSIPKNLTLEEQAHFAFEARNRVRLDARSKMVDLKALALLPESPDFETLLKSKMDRKHKTREEALQDMIDTCNKSNPRVDKYFEFEED